MKRLVVYLCFALWAGLASYAQDAGAAFQFLQLPVSSHAGGLGGDNISIVEDDITLIYHNPALLANTRGRTLSLNYMSYLQKTNIASAAYDMEVGKRSMLAFGAHYLSFGSMKHTDAEGNIMGNFTAKDMALMTTYSFDFSERWSGGVTGKLIYSNYEQVYSLGLGVDLGLNYYNPENMFSVSIVARNLGGQVKTFDETQEPLPYNLLVGFSKELGHAPIRLSATLTDLHRWSEDDFYNSGDGSWRSLVMKHIIIGADIFPTHNTYVALGYNFFRQSELKNENRRGLEGFTIGGGIQTQRIKVGVSYGKYHVAASSLMMSFSAVL